MSANTSPTRSVLVTSKATCLKKELRSLILSSDHCQRQLGSPTTSSLTGVVTMVRLNYVHCLSVNTLVLHHYQQSKLIGCVRWIQTPVSTADQTRSPLSPEPSLATLCTQCFAFAAMRLSRRRLQRALTASADSQCQTTTSLVYIRTTFHQVALRQICSTCLNLTMQLIMLTTNLIRSLHHSYHSVMVNVSLRLHCI